MLVPSEKRKGGAPGPLSGEHVAQNRMIHIDEHRSKVGSDIPDYLLLVTDEERDTIRDLIGTLPPFTIGNVTDALLTAVQLVGTKMPLRLVERFLDFRRIPNAFGMLVIRNLPTDPDLPPTPQDGRPSTTKHTWISEYCLLLVMLSMGEPIGYADEKEGALIQDVCPVQGEETAQENTGSTTHFELHTENGFHPYPPDHLGLVCLRADHEKMAKTSTACVLRVLNRLPGAALELLRQPLYKLGIASSFLLGNNKQELATVLPLLKSNSQLPQMCVDFHKMTGVTAQAQWALDQLKAELMHVCVSVVLQPGDMMIIDNRLAGHDRTSFTPRYDGFDRWIQRVFTVADLRLSQAYRQPGSPICAPLFVTMKDERL